MKLHFVSIFPNLISHWFSQGVVGRAVDNGTVVARYWNPRDYSDDRFGRVDDRPFGGGPGMVMQYEPLKRIHDALNGEEDRLLHVYLSPQGVPFCHALAAELSQKQALAFWCGRYEGVDQRFIDECIDVEISLGDFVLSGGEIAAAVISDAVLRLVPGVLGDAASAREDSFHQQLLDHPHYTRPGNIGRIRAPEILLSGDHARIARWRLKQALGRTFLYRPDILEHLELNDEQRTLLKEFLAEHNFSESRDEQHH